MLKVVLIHDKCFIVTAAVEDAADFDIARRQHQIDDNDPPLETEDASTQSKVVALAADLRKCLELLARCPDSADIADRPLMAAALLGNVAIDSSEIGLPPQGEEEDYARVFTSPTTVSA